jgi:hypothetical protein
MTAISTSTDSLAVGASRTFNLSPGSALTLVAPPNVRATITETPNTVSASGVGGNSSRTHNLQLGQTVTYGPYPMGGTVVVANASNSGTAITWVRSDSIVAESATGAVSLVSGDGNYSLAQLNRGGSALRSGKPWLRQPTTTTGMIASSGNATIAATTRRGRKCIEVTIAAVTTPQGIHIPISTPQTITAFQHMVIEVEDASEWNGGNWRLGFFDGSLGTLTNGMQIVQTVGTANGWDGIHVIAPTTVATTTSSGSTSEWAAVGTGAFGSTVMTQIAVRAVRKSGPVGTARFWIYEIAEAEKNSLPSIVVGADDGAVTWYTDGLPLCEKYGFSSYMAYIKDDRGTATRMSEAQWSDAIISRGHHAVVHGCKTGVTSLRDYFASYTGYSSPQAAMEADITYNRDGMVNEGLDPDGRGRKIYVLPQGFHQPASGAGDDTIANALTNCGMVAARRAVVENALIANGGWAGAAKYLPIIGHNWADANEATNITNLVSQMQAEIGAGRSVVLMFHEVKTPTAAQHITAANLETILAAADTLVRAGSAKKGKLTDFAGELLTYTAPVHIGQ